MHFDLISDLHCDFWEPEQQINWTGLPTSLVAVVAGDISRDWSYTYDYLLMLTHHYRHVIFVDGNHEHDMKIDIWGNSQKLQARLADNDRISYLCRSTVVLDDTAFIGCNGWWTYDFAMPEMSRQQCWDMLIDENKYDPEFQHSIFQEALADAESLVRHLIRANTDPRIRNVVIVTHSAPVIEARWTPPGMPWQHMGRAGNSLMDKCLKIDMNNKTRAWVFGHVHTEFDLTRDGIRYVCHPRGTPAMGSVIYYPKMVSI